jgi:SAM-dependent methyltransferase
MLNEWKWMLKYYYNRVIQNLIFMRKTVTDWRRFWKSYYQYKRLAPLSMQPIIQYLFPCLGDDTTETLIDYTYFYQDAWGFEKIIGRHPKYHIDVGSHHKFVALLSKVVPVTMIDIRPLPVSLESLKFLKGSILDLPFEDESVSSISSLCVVEHIGLGRYGDPLDPWGSEKAIKELMRVIEKGGHLYISVPISKINNVHFNAHRSFTRDYIIGLLSQMKLEEEAYIYGTKMYPNYNKNQDFGTGLFHFIKV